jgi:hypothetical protein
MVELLDLPTLLDPHPTLSRVGLCTKTSEFSEDN